MKTLIVIFVIIGSGYVSSHRGKRNVYQFGNMIECLTGREWSDYDGYGCWCGYGGSGGSVDSTDGCCRTHDRCYDNLVATGVCSTWQTYSEIYPYSKSCGTYPSVTCGSGSNCEERLCACDRAAAYCFRSSNFNSAYADWDNDNC